MASGSLGDNTYWDFDLKLTENKVRNLDMEILREEFIERIMSG